MKRPKVSDRLYRASTVADKTVSANSERRLREVVAKLEDCRTALAVGDDHEASQLVSVAILQLKMKLNGIANSDLRALCEEIVLHEQSNEPRI